MTNHAKSDLSMYYTNHQTHKVLRYVSWLTSPTITSYTILHPAGEKTTAKLPPGGKVIHGQSGNTGT